MVTFIPRQETFPIFQGDDEDQIYALAREIDELERRAEREVGKVQSMLDATDTAADIVELKNRRDALIREATPRAIMVTMKALGRKRWGKLIEAHPPRPGHDDDQKAGLNEEDFAEEVVRKCMLAPTFASEDERDEWLDEVSDGQFEKMYKTAVGLNRLVGADPKAMLSSGHSLSGGETSA